MCESDDNDSEGKRDEDIPPKLEMVKFILRSLRRNITDIQEPEK